MVARNTQAKKDDAPEKVEVVNTPDEAKIVENDENVVSRHPNLDDAVVNTDDEKGIEGKKPEDLSDDQRLRALFSEGETYDSTGLSGRNVL